MRREKKPARSPVARPFLLGLTLALQLVDLGFAEALDQRELLLAGVGERLDRVDAALEQLFEVGRRDALSLFFSFGGLSEEEERRVCLYWCCWGFRCARGAGSPTATPVRVRVPTGRGQGGRSLLLQRRKEGKEKPPLLRLSAASGSAAPKKEK